METRDPNHSEAYRVQQIVQTLEDSVVRLSEINAALGADTSRCLERCAEIAEGKGANELASSGDYQFWARSLVRAFSAHVEGITYAMRASAISAHGCGCCPLTTQELVLLREERYRFDARRKKIVVSPAYNRLLENVLLAFQVYPRIFGTTFDIPLQDHGWELFQRSMKVRDALVHPKAINELQISAKVALELTEAIMWFGRAVKGLLTACKQALEGQDRIGRDTNVVQPSR